MKAGEVASMASSMISLPNPQVSAPEQVQSYIGEKVGSRPALRIDTSTIMGCKMNEEPGRKALSLLLNDHGQPLELMVVAGVDRVEGVRPMGGGMYAGNLERSNLVTWSDGGNVIVLSGDLSHEDLRTYAVSLYR